MKAENIDYEEYYSPFNGNNDNNNCVREEYNQINDNQDEKDNKNIVKLLKEQDMAYTPRRYSHSKTMEKKIICK